MPKSSHRASSRQKLLDAAVDIISRQGVQELTIDAVAAAAGVTKGGLIYHFKTKDELLGALVERMVDELDQRFQERAAGLGNTFGALLTALVDEAFDMSDSDRVLQANLLAAASSYPHLMPPVQAMFARIYERCAEDEGKAGQALVLAAAMDGFVLLDLLNLHRFKPEQRQAMRQTMLAMVRSLA
jgi:AcrR family transcriptional regulator